MISLKIQKPSPNTLLAPKTYIKCPQCQMEEWYYTMIPNSCEGCGFRWGTVRHLERIVVRKYYHRKGEID